MESKVRLGDQWEIKGYFTAPWEFMPELSLCVRA